jgi:hypothetical protein
MIWVVMNQDKGVKGVEGIGYTKAYKNKTELQ